jgi:hypothetical protein
VSEHLGIARLWLHAESLELVMPGAHECLRFVAPTGPEWQAWRKTPASSAQTVPVGVLARACGPHSPACDTNLMFR